MGCCISTSRDSAQDANNSTVGVSERNSAEHAEQLRPRLAAAPIRSQLSSSHIVISHRSSRRHSRALEFESQREAEGQGLRLEERVTRPLVMHIWSSRPPLKREEVMRRRVEYYDTRVTGRKEVWDILKLAVESMDNGDLATAQEILNASGITIPTGNLIHGAYDELGTRYELPEYCCSVPRNMIVSSPDIEKHTSNASESEGDVEDLEEIEKRRYDKGKRVIHGNEKTYRVIARLSDRFGPGADIPINFEKGQPVKHLIRAVMQKGNIASTEYRVKIAYLGKILLEHDPLPDQGWVEGHIVNALVLHK